VLFDSDVWYKLLVYLLTYLLIYRYVNVVWHVDCRNGIGDEGVHGCVCGDGQQISTE